ncbi:MAG: peptidylprolyl isomerase [Gammaproteobacteria bacterium]|nr:peptidylprolyl isomerase [Gammaproteobacteria bacterium]
MKFTNASLMQGMRLKAIGLIAAGLVSANSVVAETIFSVNGADVDSAVVDLYFGSRLGNQGGQATPEQREILMGELRDIYILATQPGAEALAGDAEIAAQLDLQARSIIAQAVAQQVLREIDVTDEEMRAEYDVQVALAPKLEFKARHILVPTQSEAVDLIAELDGGTDFEELAKEKSTGPSGPNGGDLGWFSPSQMVAPFSQAVEAMEDGDYSKTPVQTQFGWHVILREDSRDSTPPTYEASVENLRAAVQQRKFQDRLDEMREAAAPK